MKHLKYILLIALVMSFASCKIFEKAQAPRFNAVTDSLAKTATEQIVNAFERWKTANDVSYAVCKSSYDSCENTLLLKMSLDSARKHNTLILNIDKNFLNQLQVARQDHINDGSITANHINVNQAILKHAGHNVVLAEDGYK